MSHRHRIVALLLLAAGALCSCGTSTQMSGIWKDPSFRGQPGQKVLVVAVGENEGNTRLWETSMMQSLQSHGVQPLAGSSYLSTGAAPPDSAAASAKISGAGANLVMVTRLLGVNPTSPHYTPGPSAYGWYGDYYNSYSVVHTPGYYVTTSHVELETNVYDFATGKLVWSGASKTMNYESANEVAGSATEAVAAALVKSDVIKSNKSK